MIYSFILLDILRIGRFDYLEIRGWDDLFIIIK